MAKYIKNYESQEDFLDYEGYDGSGPYMKSIVPGVAYVKSGGVAYNRAKTFTVEVEYEFTESLNQQRLFIAYESTDLECIKKIVIDGVEVPISSLTKNTYIDYSDYGLPEDMDSKIGSHLVVYHFDGDNLFTGMFHGYGTWLPIVSIKIGYGFTYIPDSFYYTNGHATEPTFIEIPDSVTVFETSPIYIWRTTGLGNAKVDIPDSVEDGGEMIYGDGCNHITIGKGMKTFNSINSSRCESIMCLAPTAPEIIDNLSGLPTSGTLWVPVGSDYSSWTALLPSGWTLRYLTDGYYWDEIKSEKSSTKVRLPIDSI